MRPPGQAPEDVFCVSVRTLTLLAQYARPQKQHIKNILFSGSYQRVLFVIMSMTLIRANTAKNVAGPFAMPISYPVLLFFCA